MARLTAAQRKAIPSKDFAGPGRSYPIEDASHARAALRMDHNASPGTRAKIEAAVHKRYPNIGKTSHHHHGSGAMARKYR